MQRLAYFYALAVVVMVMSGGVLIVELFSEGGWLIKSVAHVNAMVVFIISIIITIVAYAKTLEALHLEEDDNMSFARAMLLISIAPITVFVSNSAIVDGKILVGVVVTLIGILVLVFLGHLHQRYPFLDKRTRFLFS